ncbi:MAG: peptidoglycan-binding protein [Christensenellales bacterium]
MNNRIAADAAAWALSKVGCPYSQEKRNQDGVFDCSSLVARAYAAQGKRWRYGGSVPRSNQEVYDDDFELLWPEKYSEIEGSSAARTCSNARISPAIFSSFARISARAVRIESPMWRQVADAKTSSTPEERTYGVCVNRISHYAGKVCAVARFNPEGNLRAGMKGWRTLALQQKLNALGANLETDGEYGNTTAGAVKAFQHARNLPATGEADRATLEALGLAAADSGSGTENVVRITGDTVNVRRGPGTEYESIAIAHKGDTLPAVAADDWQPVLFGGEIRWVSMKYASLEPAK